MKPTLVWTCLAFTLLAQDPFSLTPAALRQSATAIDANNEEGAVVVLDDHRYSFDAQGRLTRIHRQIIHVRKADAVEEWAEISVAWNPWHEQRPEIVARVVSATGELHPFDPRTIAEAPVQQFDSNIFSDQRLLRAPLPAVKAGAVIEWQSTVRESAPVFNAGVAFVLPVTAKRTRVLIESDAPLQHVAHLLEPKLTREGRRTRLSVETGPPPESSLEPWAPRSPSSQPYLAFSTGTSWQAVAGRYEEMVEQQLRGAQLADLVAGVTGETRAARIAAVVQKVREQVRYTGVEFGEAAIVPRTPAEVLARKYGDCKDTAALLVAALRALKIPAYVALLNVTSPTDLEPNLPGFLFDHAIVYVPASEAVAKDQGGEFWIDSTDEVSRLGDLPRAVQGRWALVARASTTGLELIPQATAQQNRVLITRKVTLSGSGGADLIETVEANGAFETGWRQRYLGKQGEDLRKAAQPEGRVRLVEVKAVSKTGDGDYARPYRLEVKAANYQAAQVRMNEGFVAIGVGDLLGELPYVLLSDPAGAKPRKAELVLPLTYTAEIRYDVTPPAGFRVRPLPKNELRKLGSFTYSVDYRTQQDGRFEVVQRFEAPRRRLSAAEATEAQASLWKLLQEEAVLIQMVHVAQEQLAAGEWVTALEGLRRGAAAEPNSVAPQLRLSQAYLTVGAGEMARAAARQAVALDAKSAEAQVALGTALEHDALGRLRKSGWDPQAAEAAYRQALTLDPKHAQAQLSLAILLEHNQSGERFGAGARLEEAAREYQRVTGLAQTQAALNRALVLYHGGKIAEFAQTVQSPGMPLMLQLMATAVQETPAAAVVRAQQLAGDAGERAQLLWAASFQLIADRRYPAALALAKTAARLMPESNRQLMFVESLVRASPGSPNSEPGPEAVAEEFRRAIIEELDDARLSLLLSRHFPLAEAQQTIERSRREMIRAGEMAQVLSKFGASRAVLADLALGPPLGEREGDNASGYRLGGPTANATFLTWEDGRYKLLGTAANLSGVGRAALAAAQAGDLTQTQRWLNWVVDLPARGNDGSSVPPFKVIWSGSTELSRTALPMARLAAACLIVRDTPTDNEAVAILEAARVAEKVAALRSPYEQALAEARLARGEYRLALPLATALQARFPTADLGYRLKLRALIALEDWPQLELAVKSQTATASAPQVGRVRVIAVTANPQSSLALAQAAALRRQWTKAAELLAPLCAEEFPDEQVLQACAWTGLAVGKVEAKLRESLQKNDYRGNLVLAAAAEATLRGELAEATSLLQRSLTVRSLAAPDGPTWYLHARLLKSLGADAAAREALKRVSATGRTPFDWAQVVSQALAAASGPPAPKAP